MKTFPKNISLRLKNTLGQIGCILLLVCGCCLLMGADMTNAPLPNLDPELQIIIDLDNETQAETDKWIREYRELNKDDNVTDSTLPLRVMDRFSIVQKAYEEYLFTHSESLEGRLAYASFLADIGKDNEAVREWLRLLDKYPNNPTLLNNMGNYHGQKGDAEKAFPYYEKAIKLSPKEPLYIKNLASVVYIFRQEAMNYYRLTEQQTILLAQALYQKAELLSPKDFVLLTQLAQVWYFIKPFNYAKAKADWDKAYALASDDSERQGVILHYARLAILNDDLDTAEKELAKVTWAKHQELKKELLSTVAERRNPSRETSEKPE